MGARVYKNYTADYKFFQEHQQKSRRFPVFPGEISNSRRFPVFPGVVDTLCTVPRAVELGFKKPRFFLKNLKVFLKNQVFLKNLKNLKTPI